MIVTRVVGFLSACAIAAVATSGAGAIEAQGGAAGQGAQAPVPIKTTASVLGQVVDAGTGAPIPDAIVTMTGRSLQTGRSGAPDLMIRPPNGPPPQGAGAIREITDASGHFVFRDLPKGTFAVSASADGYLSGNINQTRLEGPSRPFSLDDDQHVVDAKIRLWRNAVVTGTVVDEAGEPVVGIDVRLLRRTFAGGKPRLTNGGPSERTDDRGVYRFSGVAPGDYVVSLPQTQESLPATMLEGVVQTFASAMPNGGSFMNGLMGGALPTVNPMSALRIGDYLVMSDSGLQPMSGSGGRMTVYPTTYFPSTSSSAQAQTVSLKSGEERGGVDLQLRAVPAGRVLGHVTGAAGFGIGTQVQLLSESDAGDNIVATAICAADGSFAFLGVPDGQYVARIQRNPLPPLPPEMAGNPMIQMAYGAAGVGMQVMMFAQAPVAVSGDAPASVTLALREGLRVSGRMEFQGSSPQPSPAQLRAVTLTATSTAGGAGGAQPVRPDQDGAFRLNAEMPGHYFLTAGPVQAAPAQGGAPARTWQIKSVMLDGRDVVNDGFDLRDSDVTDVVVTFGDQSSQLTGTVRGSGDVASTAATVVLFPADYRGWESRGMTSRLYRSQSASATGVYSFASIPPGDYLVVAIDDAAMGDGQDPAFIESLSRAATRVTIVEGDKKTQDLRLAQVSR